MKVEGLESLERKGVLGVIEEEAILTGASPAMQPVLQVADDIGEVGNGTLAWFKKVCALDCLPELALLFEVEPEAFIVPLDQHSEEAEEKMQVLLLIGK